MLTWKEVVGEGPQVSVSFSGTVLLRLQGEEVNFRSLVVLVISKYTRVSTPVLVTLSPKDHRVHQQILVSPPLVLLELTRVSEVPGGRGKEVKRSTWETQRRVRGCRWDVFRLPEGSVVPKVLSHSQSFPSPTTVNSVPPA